MPECPRGRRDRSGKCAQDCSLRNDLCSWDAKAATHGRKNGWSCARNIPAQNIPICESHHTTIFATSHNVAFKHFKKLRSMLVFCTGYEVVSNCRKQHIRCHQFQQRGDLPRLRPVSFLAVSFRRVPPDSMSPGLRQSGRRHGLKVPASPEP
jgi:hypothetical protein